MNLETVIIRLSLELIAKRCELDKEIFKEGVIKNLNIEFVGEDEFIFRCNIEKDNFFERWCVNSSLVGTHVFKFDGVKNGHAEINHENGGTGKIRSTLSPL